MKTHQAYTLSLRYNDNFTFLVMYLYKLMNHHRIYGISSEDKENYRVIFRVLLAPGTPSLGE